MHCIKLIALIVALSLVGCNKKEVIGTSSTSEISTSEISTSEPETSGQPEAFKNGSLIIDIPDGFTFSKYENTPFISDKTGNNLLYIIVEDNTAFGIEGTGEGYIQSLLNTLIENDKAKTDRNTTIKNPVTDQEITGIETSLQEADSISIAGLTAKGVYTEIKSENTVLCYYDYFIFRNGFVYDIGLIFDKNSNKNMRDILKTARFE